MYIEYGEKVKFTIEEMQKLEIYLIKNNFVYDKYIKGSKEKIVFNGVDMSYYQEQIVLGGISIISGTGTYGGDRGLLELYNFADDPEGHMTAENVIQYIRRENAK